MSQTLTICTSAGRHFTSGQVRKCLRDDSIPGCSCNLFTVGRPALLGPPLGRVHVLPWSDLSLPAFGER